MAKKEKDNKNVTSRIGEKFSKEIEEIKEARLKSGIDKKKKSTRKITNVIIKHEDWEKIKKDTIELNKEDFEDE